MQQLFLLLIFLIQPYMFRATNFTHPQEQVLTVYTTFGQMHRHYCQPCQGWDGNSFHLNRGTGWQQCRSIVPTVVYTVKKCSWEWANLSPETCRTEL